MRAQHAWLRRIALVVGPLLLAGLGAPAHAADPDPGKPSGPDVVAQLLGGALGGDDSGPGGMLSFALFGLVPLALGGLRLSRGIARASRAITKSETLVRSRDSFEDRLAEKLRELEPRNQAAILPSPEPEHAPPPIAQRPGTSAPPGPRTFGRRVG